MRVIAKSRLREYWLRYSDAEDSLLEWHENTEKAVWASPNDITETCAGVSILRESRVCFNIKGNTYRLIVAVNYATGFVLIKWFGAHAEVEANFLAAPEDPEFDRVRALSDLIHCYEAIHYPLPERTSQTAKEPKKAKQKALQTLR